MTNFERTYVMNQPPKISITYTDGKANNTRANGYQAIIDAHKQIRMQMEYRELDRIANEMEKELQEVRALRQELENYKVEFSMKVEDEATAKIQAVLDNFERAISK